MAWSEKAGALVSTSRTPEELVDGIPLAVGIITLLRQFHPACLERFVSMLSQHVRAQLHAAFAKEPKPAEPPADAANSIRFLVLFCQWSGEKCDELPLLEAVVGLN